MVDKIKFEKDILNVLKKYKYNVTNVELCVIAIKTNEEPTINLIYK